ncbi:MAG: ribosome silencing factor [Phycisphaerae bacterium]|nr:ribosome silencing factor [Phycisphaerae bacterium]
MTDRIDAREFAIEIARIAEANRCEDVVVQDLRGVSEVCDFFVICTGTSDRQMRTVIDHVGERARLLGHRRFGLSGYDDAYWILADYVDVVLHVFTASARSYYDLDLLWGDVEQVEGWQDERPGE